MTNIPRAQMERDILACRFRVELSDRGRPSHRFHRDDYQVALRDTVDELLGSGGDHARIYLGGELVAEGGLQYRRVRGGGKISVRISGEKPRKGWAR